jgi:hypothetical protein
MFDLMPLQDALNSLASTALTNQHAFGTQNIWTPRGADINYQQLVGGLNHIESNVIPGAPGGGMPQPLQLTATAPEIFNYMKMIEQWMEVLSGVNAVARGNPSANLRSGTSLALIQSQALEFVSGLQHKYVQLIEDVGTGIIHLLQDFAHTPRVVAIVGEDNITEMEEFSGDDIDLINRVFVDVGNPLANTTAGKFEIAQQMLQMYGDKISPEQLIMVLNTGRLENVTDGLSNQMYLIKSENKDLIKGQTPVQAIAIEDHVLHIKEHRGVLSDAKLKNDPELVGRVMTHIQEHIDLLKTTNPDLLAILGQQSLQQPQLPANQAGGQGGGPQDPGLAGAPNPIAAGQTGVPEGTLPGQPDLPESPTGGPLKASDMPLQS